MTHNYTRREDALPAGRNPGQPVQLAPILGDWRGTNPLGQGISRFAVSQKDSGGYVRIYGTGEVAENDWGEVPISTLYARDAGSSEPMAFEAFYDLGFMSVHVQANFSLGLMVLACFNTFKDGSGRSNYFSREFFHREK